MLLCQSLSQICNTLKDGGILYCGFLKITLVEGNVMKIKAADEVYVEKATNLTTEETERLLSRMRGKLTRRRDDKKLSTIEALAIQLEIDDENLAEWRERMNEINKKDKDKK
jgi:hypothetical protein